MTSVVPLLEGKRIVICAGSGGVGKTTTSAALAMGMAERGMKVAVVTIDPAKRLANALGMDELGNEPHLVELDLDGELWAMMLDAKRTFDEVIERLAPDDATREEIFENRIYQQLSSAVAGSQEFTAIAKLFELDQEGDYDLLVLDTPPSRNALDFLDAPGRLTGFFQGRAIRIFLRPAGFGGKIIGRGTGVVFSLLKRVTGVDLLEDLSVFFRSLAGLIDGFTERAERVGALLADPATTFLIVTSPQHDPVEEAIFFHRKLMEARMPFGGIVVNRVHAIAESDGEVPAELVAELGEGLAERVADSAREQAALAARDHAAIGHLEAALHSPPTVRVPELEDDVHDIDGLAQVRAHLFADWDWGSVP
jgi:anion-transporting  ArsA/GET3 family ATPase